MGLKFSRRDFIVLSGFSLFSLPVLFSPLDIQPWQIPNLIQLKIGESFELRSTLPQQLKQTQGRFSVDPAGPALPGGVHLSLSGILHIDSNLITQDVTISGLIFNYDEA